MTLRGNLTYSAPVGSVDLAAEDYEIWPCTECLPWHLEIVRDLVTDETIAREWHAIECPMLVELLSDSGQGGID